MATIASNGQQVRSSSERLVRHIQQTLMQEGPLPGFSIYVRTAEGRRLSVVDDACIGVQRDHGNAATSSQENGAFCFTSGEGDRVFVEGRCTNEATVRLVNALIRSLLQTLEAEEREELLLEELGANWESLEALYEISTDALRSGDVKDALKRLIERLTGLQDGLHSALFIRRDQNFHALVSTEQDVQTLSPGQLGMVQKAMQETRVMLLNHLSEAPHPRACWRKATGLAVAPFSWKGSIGFIIVWCEDRSCEFGSPFSRVLEAITYQASVMMEGDRLNRRVRESELLAQEIEIASSIQQTLLLANAPKDLPALEFAACSVPSKQIDGDFHDFFQHPDGTVDVLIGDVMGKGVAAALLGAATKSQFLRATANLALQSRDTAPRPEKIVTRAASRLSDRLISLDRFVTLCYARFDVTAQTVVFVDCGHTSMIRESKSESKGLFLRGDDLPLGVLPDYQCREHVTKLHRGETYLLYSDGVTENRSPEGEFFGAGRLAKCVQDWSSLGPTLLVEQIRREAERFAGSAKFADDFTCIAVRIKLESPNEELVASERKTFECDTRILGNFRLWLRRCAKLGGCCLGEDDVARLELACSEVFTNCALHARDFSAGSPVSVEGRIFADRVTLQISHRGPEFNPLSVPPPSFDGSREGGFGIYIVLRSADEACFDRAPDGTNITTLCFLRSRMETQ